MDVKNKCESFRGRDSASRCFPKQLSDEIESLFPGVDVLCQPGLFYGIEQVLELFGRPKSQVLDEIGSGDQAGMACLSPGALLGSQPGFVQAIDKSEKMRLSGFKGPIRLTQVVRYGMKEHVADERCAVHQETGDSPPGQSGVSVGIEEEEGMQMASDKEDDRFGFFVGAFEPDASRSGHLGADCLVSIEMHRAV